MNIAEFNNAHLNVVIGPKQGSKTTATFSVSVEGGDECDFVIVSFTRLTRTQFDAEVAKSPNSPTSTYDESSAHEKSRFRLVLIRSADVEKLVNAAVKALAVIQGKSNASTDWVLRKDGHCSVASPLVRFLSS
jgi:hypothetical protein